MNYDALRNYQVPESRQRFTRRDAILYALSVGVGQEPLDPWQLGFVDERASLDVLPSFCLVLGHPGLWLSDPRTTVDARRLVHVEESFRVSTPIAAEGEVVGTTRIVDVVDKGAEKGALLYLEKRLHDAESGELLATTERTLMLRGDGGYGGPSGVPRPTPAAPQGEPEVTVDVPTRPEAALIYRLNGDPNPLHLDPTAAAKAGFPRPILHGLCTYGIACQAAVRILAGGDPNKLTAMTARFTAPVYPGETIRIEFWNDGAFRARSIERDVVVVNNGRVTITR